MEEKKDDKKETNSSEKESAGSENNSNENLELEKNIDENKENPDLKKKQNSQVIWAIIMIALVIIIIIATPVIINNFFNRFEYIGLKIQKTKYENVVFYSTYVPLTATKPITGSLISENQITGNYALNLREDPRTLYRVATEINSSNITFIPGKVFISFNSSDPPCQRNTISAIELSQFLSDFGKLKIEGAVTEKEYAELNNVPYVTCENNLLNTVILIKKGEENIIKKNNRNCYELIYKECDVLPVTEKFIWAVIENYMSYFEKK